MSQLWANQSASWVLPLSVKHCRQGRRRGSAEVAVTPCAHTQPPSARPSMPPCWPCTTLVCKQWRSLAWQQPALWSRLTIRAPPALPPAVSLQQWFGHKLALVRRVAHLLTAAEVMDGGGFEEGWMAALLASFNPAVLTILSIRCEYSDASTSGARGSCRRQR